MLGTSKRHRNQFFSKHPVCAFCGGGTPATTIEHCPPRAMFLQKKWPEGFEFPACEACNHGTTNDDLLISLVARFSPNEARSEIDPAFVGLAKAVNKQFPGLIAKMSYSPSEARAMNRKLGRLPAHGYTHQDSGLARVPNEIHTAVGTLSTKLAKAVYYYDSGMIFPQDGCLAMMWFTNATAFEHGSYPVIDALSDLAGVSPTIVRAGVYLDNQFGFTLSASEQKDFFVLQSFFGSSFGFATFGSTIAGQLESILTSVKENNGDKASAVILQSKSLPLGRF